MPKCFFDRGSTPDPTGRAYSAAPDPLAAFQGLTSKGRGLREGEEEGGKGKEMESEGRAKVKGGNLSPQLPKAGDVTALVTKVS